MKIIKKKVAFCFSGQARRFNICYPYIKKFLFDPIGKNGIDYDIFCCVEDDEDCSKILEMFPTEIQKVKTENFEEEHKDIIKQNYRKYVTRQDLNKQFNQLNKILISNEIRKKYEKKYNISYDWVIRIRFDTFPINEIDYSKLNKRYLYIPKTSEMRFSSCNDMFAVGSGKLIDIYSDRIKSFDEIVKTFYFKKTPFPFKLSFFLERIYIKVFKFFIKLIKEDNYISKFFKKMIITREHFFKKVPFENFYTLECALFKYLKQNDVKLQKLDIDYILIRKKWHETGVFLTTQPGYDYS